MKSIVQYCLFDDPQVVAQVKEPELSKEASNLINDCRGFDGYEQEKILRLSREYIRQEVRHFFGFPRVRSTYDYPQLIQRITSYNTNNYGNNRKVNQGSLLR